MSEKTEEPCMSPVDETKDAMGFERWRWGLHVSWRARLDHQEKSERCHANKALAPGVAVSKAQ